jgi:SNF2 family DNA or RNA helicase
LIITRKDNIVHIKYKDYNEYQKIGKPAGAKWDKENKIWYYDLTTNDIKVLYDFVQENKLYIENLKSEELKLDEEDIVLRNNFILINKEKVKDMTYKQREIISGLTINRIKNDKYYFISRNYGTAKIINKIFGTNLDLGLKPRQIENYEDKIFEFLYPHQKEGVKWIIDMYKKGYMGALLADDMGLGKTAQSLATYFVLKQLNPNLKLFIVATKSTIKNAWFRDMSKFFGVEPKIVSTSEINDGSAFKEDVPVVTNYESLSYVNRKSKTNIISLDENYILILDEVTKVKNNTSDLYKTIQKLRGNAFAIGITGTPVENNLLEFFNILNILHPDFLSKYIFNNLFVIYKEIQIGRKTIHKVVGHNNLELFHHISKDMMLRRSKNTRDLPEKYIKTIVVPLTEEQKRLIESVREIATEKYNETIAGFSSLTIIKRISNHPKLIEMGESKLALDIKVTDYTSPKLEKLKELLNVIKKKVVIFTEYEDMADILYEELSKEYKVLKITGQDSGKKRDKIVKQFKNNDIDILIATDALAYGVNLQFAHSLVNFDIPWNPAKRAQRIDRIHRLGIKEERYIYDLVSEGLEEKAYEIIIKKLQVFVSAIEGKDNIYTSSVISQLSKEYLQVS